MRRLAFLVAFVVPALGACGDLLYVGDEVRSVKVTLEGITQEVSLEGLGVVTVAANEGAAPVDRILARVAPELWPRGSLGYRIDVVTAKGERPAELAECKGLIPIDGALADSVLVGNKLRRLFFSSGSSLCAPEDVAELVFVRKGAELCEAARVHTLEGLRQFCADRSCWYCECELQGLQTQYYGTPGCGEPWGPPPACDGNIWFSARICLEDPEACVAAAKADEFHRARCYETPK